MSSLDAIKPYSVDQVETAFREALEKLTGKKHDVHVSELLFDAAYRGNQCAKMTLYFNETWEPSESIFG